MSARGVARLLVLEIRFSCYTDTRRSAPVDRPRRNSPAVLPSQRNPSHPDVKATTAHFPFPIPSRQPVGIRPSIHSRRVASLGAFVVPLTASLLN